MNKRSRKTRGLPLRLAALLLCCVCLVSVVSVSVIALEAEASPVTEETTAPTEGTPETTVPQETTCPTDPDAEIMPVSETEETTAPTEAKETTAPVETEAPAETEETTAPSEEAEQTDPTEETKEADPTEETEAKSEADALYERLMACKTYTELEAVLNGLTEEEQALLDHFTAEQNTALETKVKELDGYGAVTLAEDFTIFQGGTQVVILKHTIKSIDSYTCSPTCSGKHTYWMGFVMPPVT